MEKRVLIKPNLISEINISWAMFVVFQSVRDCGVRFFLSLTQLGLHLNSKISVFPGMKFFDSDKMAYIFFEK